MKLTYNNLDRAINAAADILCINPDDITVDIFRDSNDCALGYCSGDLDEVHISINQCLQGNDWVEVLAHELIHAKQYLHGELEDAQQFVHYWHGNKFVTIKELFDYDAYRNLPWEAEAFNGQYKLMKDIYNVLQS